MSNKKTDPPSTFYRYEDILMDYYLNQAVVKLKENRYKLIRETPCGYWIAKHSNYLFSFDDDPDNQRWVSKTSRKRFAYPTKHEALTSFKYRKQRQIRLVSVTLSRAKAALDKCLKELDHNRKEYNEKKNKAQRVE